MPSAGGKWSWALTCVDHRGGEAPEDKRVGGIFRGGACAWAVSVDTRGGNAQPRRAVRQWTFTLWPLFSLHPILFSLNGYNH